ncbi:HNH endonuclease [Acidovorax sp. LjRoot117]|uniref:HNH endonuclease n=1 Tax=Acidovorax sp. LjRoot117 TaxID=3342255 RepID=UPI003ECDC176
MDIAGTSELLAMSLEAYREALRRLNVNVRDGRASPHKLCLLLAVFDLAKAGALAENRIFFGPALLERYYQFFDAVRAPTDHANPYFPYFHLGGRLRSGQPSFWHLRPLPGRETIARAMTTARSMADITRNFAWAELDDELFRLLQNPDSLMQLSTTLASHWFDRGLQDLRQVVAHAGEVSRYEQRLRQSDPLTAAEAAPPMYVRNPAFRRVVTEVYDYRCAASGVRIILSSGETMVEAAHIHPFSEAGDDDPRNGLALTPDFHWAMDRHLIAPGPDLCWHVSPMLDERIADHARLTSLKGKKLLLPSQSRFVPKREALVWRLERLRGSALEET